MQILSARHIDAIKFLQQIRYMLPGEASLIRMTDAPIRPKKIVVCVSGGPDSMALAHLLRQARYSSLPDQLIFEPHAIIVDHDARPDSAAEAKRVKGYLNELDIESTILQLRWPRGINPSVVSHFETEARQRRYEAIARHAVQLHTRTILAGHHQDDQAETVLMRIAQTYLESRGPSKQTLRGIAPVTPLPCCDNLFETQHTLTNNPYNLNLQATLEKSWPRRYPGRNNQKEPISPHEPLLLHRPLLAFSKEEILATCRHYDIPYVLDGTNYDPQLTTRNTIRYLRSNFKLPRALQSGRLLQLQKSSHDNFEHIRTRGNELARLFEIRLLSTSSSAITVKFSLSALQHQLRQDPASVSYAFARIVESVSPIESSQFPVFLSNLTLRRLMDEHPMSKASTFTNQQVLFSPAKDNKLGDGWKRWMLSRQPMDKREAAVNTITFRSANAQANDKQISEWILWDKRVWIRICVLSGIQIPDFRLRPYSEKDVSVVKAALAGQRFKLKFESMLDRGTPGKIRFTLPVLEHESQIVAFPTLNSWINRKHGVTFEARYPSKARVDDFFTNST